MFQKNNIGISTCLGNKDWQINMLRK